MVVQSQTDVYYEIKQKSLLFYHSTYFIITESFQIESMSVMFLYKAYSSCVYYVLNSEGSEGGLL